MLISWLWLRLLLLLLGGLILRGCGIASDDASIDDEGNADGMTSWSLSVGDDGAW